MEGKTGPHVVGTGGGGLLPRGPVPLGACGKPGGAGMGETAGTPSELGTVWPPAKAPALHTKVPPKGPPAPPSREPHPVPLPKALTRLPKVPTQPTPLCPGWAWPLPTPQRGAGRAPPLALNKKPPHSPPLRSLAPWGPGSEGHTPVYFLPKGAVHPRRSFDPTQECGTEEAEWTPAPSRPPDPRARLHLRK